MSSITDTLRHARKAAGLTQRQLAAILGISPQYLADIEHGRRELSPERYYAALPQAIRTPVIRATIQRSRETIAALQAMLRA